MLTSIPPLCIIQARYHSTRLPGKMLLTLGGETLIARAWRIAGVAFGDENCIVAIPAKDEEGPLGDELRRIGADIFPFDGHENDVLGRFYRCANERRWTDDAVIVRYTPDDWNKDPGALRRVAAGYREPVEIGGEAFTLSMLNAANRDCAIPWDFNHEAYYANPYVPRHHMTWALFCGRPARKAPPGVWTIDTPEDYEAAKAIYGA